MRRDNLRALVGSTVLDMRNRWVSVTEISFLTEATPRQISAILSQIPGADVESGVEEWGRAVRLNADDAEAKRIWAHLMYWRYHCDDIYGTLESRIPYAGWISVRDLASEMGMLHADVARCLEWMDGIDVKGTKKQMMCHRIGDYHVSKYQGASDTGDVGSERRGRPRLDGQVQRVYRRHRGPQRERCAGGPQERLVQREGLPFIVLVLR